MKKKKKNGTSRSVLLDMNAAAICVVRGHQAVQWLLRVPVLVRLRFRGSGTGDASGF